MICILSRMEMQNDLIPTTEAAKLLGVSSKTMARLVKEGKFHIYKKPTDLRVKLVSRAEVLELKDRVELAA